MYPGKGSVTFTAGRTPSQFGRFSVPFTIQGWTWSPDGGSATTPCTPTTNPCTYSPTTSGTMQVTALVNGVSETKSVHIKELCGATGDSLADSLPVLDAIGAAMDSAGEDDVPANRKEFTWHVDCDTTGSCEPTVEPLWPTATACESHMVRDTTGRRVAEGHVHPFVPIFGGYAAPSEQLPLSCGKGSGKGSGKGPGPGDFSQDSSDVASGWSNPIPQYVADKRYFTHWFPDTMVNNMKQQAKSTSLSRGNGSCARY